MANHRHRESPAAFKGGKVEHYAHTGACPSIRTIYYSGSWSSGQGGVLCLIRPSINVAIARFSGQAMKLRLFDFRVPAKDPPFQTTVRQVMFSALRNWEVLVVCKISTLCT